jgi:predicted dehydrogenase
MKYGVLIGCGYFAQNHLHAWQMIEDATIVAVCDIDKERAEAYAKQFGIDNVYTSVHDMLEAESLDFVDIATQAHTHLELVRTVAAHNINIICQKPLAPSLEDARALVAASQNVTLMVHENFRWQRPMIMLKQAVSQLGDLFFGRIHFRSGHDVYANQPYLATDARFIIYDLGVHLFDLARFFFGDAQTLTCHTQRVNPNIAAEDVATALLTMQSGAHVVVDMSYASKLEQELFPQTLIHLEGTLGSATLDANYQLTVVTPVGTHCVDASPQAFDWTPEPVTAIPESVYNIQKHYIHCLSAGTRPDTSGEDNLKTLELTFGAYYSAAEKALIDMDKVV